LLLQTLVMNVSTSAQLLQLDAARDVRSSAGAAAAVPVTDTAQVSTRHLITAVWNHATFRD
jgi:hypothetical protein